jgi:ribonucleoside-diphosphate reductase alpha chain
VRNVFQVAYRKGCKGVTIYRDSSRAHQVLQKGTGWPTEERREGGVGLRDMVFPRPRPAVVKGITRKMVTSCGDLYVTINWDERGQPFEIFNSMGKAGGCASSQSEAIGRLASLALRSGIDPDEIVRQLRGITCHLPRGLGKKRISSCADAVAQALQYYLHPDAETQTEGPHENDHLNSDTRESSFQEGMLYLRGACPECQGPVEHEGGCFVCRNCGYSDCY